MAGVFVTALADYIRQIGARPFAFGDLDCCTLMADWIVSVGLVDPMADRRGAYATREEYRAAMRSEGGIIRSCERRFAAIGLETTDTPAAGDVCLVRAPIAFGRRIRQGATGAICLSDRLRAVVTPDAGLVIAALPIAKAWRVNHA